MGKKQLKSFSFSFKVNDWLGEGEVCEWNETKGEYSQRIIL